MRKIYTLLGSLLIGSCAFSANAQTAIPASGSMITEITYDGFLVSWDDQELYFNENSPAYNEADNTSWYPQPPFISVNVKVNGEELMGWDDEPATLRGYLGTYEYGWFNSASEGTILDIIDENGVLSGISAGNLTFTIPKGSILVGSSKTECTEVVLTYQYVNLNSDDIVFNPSKGSTQSSVSQVTLTWEPYSLVLNPDYYGESPVYGTYSFDIWSIENPQPISSILENGDGSITVYLGTNYTKVGSLRIEFPAEYFLVKVDENTSVPFSNDISVSYNISDYGFSPANFRGTFAPVNSFFVYASKSIAYSEYADVSSIIVNDRENDLTVSSYENTTFEGKPALEFFLSQPYIPADNASLYVTIPSGQLIINGDDIWSDISWEFYVYPEPEKSIETGSNIQEIEEVTFSFSNREVSLNPQNKAKAYLTNDKVSIDVSSYLKPVITTSVNEMTGTTQENYYLVLDFGDDPFILPGTYTLTIPEGFVIVNFDTFTIPNSEITATYTVQGTGTTTYLDNSKMVVNPAIDSQKSSLGWVTVSWPNTELYTSIIDMSNITVTLDGKAVALTSDGNFPDQALVQTINGVSQLRLYFPTLWDETGDVEITVAAGCVVAVDGSVNQAFSLTYELVEPAGAPTWSPENGTQAAPGELKVTATWKDNITVNKTASAPYISVWVDGAVTERLSVDSLMTVSEKAIVFDFTKLPNGTYQLVIPEGYLTVGDVINGDLTYSFEITDSTAIARLSEQMKLDGAVYNLQGVKVGDSLENLPKGIYIVNGKKVFIR